MAVSQVLEAINQLCSHDFVGLIETARCINNPTTKSRCDICNDEPSTSNTFCAFRTAEMMNTPVERENEATPASAAGGSSGNWERMRKFVMSFFECRRRAQHSAEVGPEARSEPASLQVPEGIHNAVTNRPATPGPPSRRPSESDRSDKSETEAGNIPDQPSTSNVDEDSTQNPLVVNLPPPPSTPIGGRESSPPASASTTPKRTLGIPTMSGLSLELSEKCPPNPQYSDFMKMPTGYLKDYTPDDMLGYYRDAFNENDPWHGFTY